MSTEHSPSIDTSTDQMDRSDPLLSVENLVTHIHTDRGTIRAVDGVDFEIGRGETVCLVGESGSGKSVTSESITRIVPRPPAEIVSGSIEFDGLSLLELSEKEIRRVRGDHIAHIFQNPQNALDPVYTVGDQIVEAITIHRDVSDTDARNRAIDLLRKVGIPRASDRIDEYPHEFSGGMRQRVAIAIALAADPKLLIADEPTTAVDVTVQARLIELMREMAGEGMSMLWITHDLRVVAAIADRVLVMYGGTIVERGPVADVFSNPAHPYTQALFRSYDGLARREKRSAREAIPPNGCRFREECAFAVDACAGGAQPAFEAVPGSTIHTASCVHFAQGEDPGPILDQARDARPIATGGGGDD